MSMIDRFHMGRLYNADRIRLPTLFTVGYGSKGTWPIVHEAYQHDPTKGVKLWPFKDIVKASCNICFIEEVGKQLIDSH